MLEVNNERPESVGRTFLYNISHLVPRELMKSNSMQSKLDMTV